MRRETDKWMWKFNRLYLSKLPPFSHFFIKQLIAIKFSNVNDRIADSVWWLFRNIMSMIYIAIFYLLRFIHFFLLFTVYSKNYKILRISIHNNTVVILIEYKVVCWPEKIQIKIDRYARSKICMWDIWEVACQTPHSNTWAMRCWSA